MEFTCSSTQKHYKRLQYPSHHFSMVLSPQYTLDWLLTIIIANIYVLVTMCQPLYWAFYILITCPKNPCLYFYGLHFTNEETGWNSESLSKLLKCTQLESSWARIWTQFNERAFLSILNLCILSFMKMRGQYLRGAWTFGYEIKVYKLNWKRKGFNYVWVYKNIILANICLFSFFSVNKSFLYICALGKKLMIMPATCIP